MITLAMLTLFSSYEFNLLLGIVNYETLALCTTSPTPIVAGAVSARTHVHTCMQMWKQPRSMVSTSGKIFVNKTLRALKSSDNSSRQSLCPALLWDPLVLRTSIPNSLPLSLHDLRWRRRGSSSWFSCQRALPRKCRSCHPTASNNRQHLTSISVEFFQRVCSSELWESIS